MKIKHRLALRHDDPLWRDFDRLGLDYERGRPEWPVEVAMSVLQVTEDQPEWPEVARIIAKHRLVDEVSNVFTKAELDAAEWLDMTAVAHHGYPQPDDDFGYREATYDIADYCATCGIGGVQKAPFRLRAEFKVSQSQFLQLNWVFDAFFVREEARLRVCRERISGVEYRAPVLHTSNQPSERVSQMVVTTVLRPALDVDGLQPVTCKPQNEESSAGNAWRPVDGEEGAYCGRVKYHSMHRGALRFDRAAFSGVPDIVKSHEWFGSGASAHQRVLVSQRFRRLVVTAKWRGVAFEPVELIGGAASPGPAVPG